MPGGVNRVVLCGTIGKYGVEMRYAPSGTACASFMLVVAEQTPEAKWFSTMIPCEAWGKKAEAASEIEAGQLVVFEGKLKRRQKSDKTWELVVSGFEVSPITAAVPAMAGSN